VELSNLTDIESALKKASKMDNVFVIFAEDSSATIPKGTSKGRKL